LKDRFGPYPQAVEHLLELVRLRLKATMMGFRKLTVGKKSVVLEFPPESDTQFYESAAFQSLMSHVSHMNKKQAVLRQQGKMLSLVYSVDPSSGADPFHTAHHLLDELLDLSQNASERAQAVTAG